MEITILVCGSRDWTNWTEIHNFLYSLLSEHRPEEVTIIEGACKGADKMSGALAENLGMKVIEVPANWVKYGSTAGPIRNQEMLDKYKPALVVAFHNDIENSKGTKDMVTRARAQGFCVKVQSYTDFFR